MGEVENRQLAPRLGIGKLALLALAGATAAAWVSSRRDEEELRLRTERRLRPLEGRNSA